MATVDHARITDVVDIARGVVGDAWVISDPTQLRSYECDGLTGHRVAPAAVILPGSTEETSAVVRACHAAGIAFVARGAGTGLSGGALPTADGVVIGLQRMRSILAVDLDDGLVTVEPGVTNLAITEAVAAHGFYYAPDPSSQSACTIGGNVAENSGGAHCLKYGFTTHHVRAATVVLPDGTVSEFGSRNPDTAGYDLLGVLIGSEGTLGIVTELVVGILPKPQHVETVFATFPSTDTAGEAVSAIIAEGVVPAAVEMMDRLAIEGARTVTGADWDAAAALIVELDGPAPEVHSQLAAVVEICERNHADSVHVAADDHERSEIWRARKSAFPAMGKMAPSYYVQDGVIPRTKLPEVLRDIQSLELEFGLRVANVFHAGDGNLHPLVLYDESVEGETERAEALATRIIEICVDHGGSITGEHGVGRDKVCSMPRMFDGADLTAFDRVRAAFDPDGICNPGKLLPTPRLCGEVPGFYRRHPLERAGLGERL
jgi:glycolate oxidase